METFLPVGTQDFKTQLMKLNNENPDAVLVIAHPKHYVLILKQMKELGISFPILASEVIYDDGFLEIAGSLADGILFTTYADVETKGYEKYVRLHKERYNTEPSAFSAAFYDNTILVLKALIETQGNIEKVKDYLYAVDNFNGATGITNYDANGDVVGKSYTIYKIKNSKFSPYER